MKRVRFTVCLVVMFFSSPAALAETRFHFELLPAQVVPPSASIADGHAACTLNDTETELAFVMEHTVADATTAAVYSGAGGTNGTLAYTFSSATSPIVETWNLGPDDVTDLLAGNLYVQIDSTTYPAGDIRGQIAPKDEPEPGDVIISEIMYNPRSDEQLVGSAPEWIELFNTTYADIRIGGLSFQDEDRMDGNPCILQRSGHIPDYVLPSFEVVVIIPDGDTAIPTVADFKTAWGLTDDAPVIQLNSDGTANGGIVGSNLANSPFSDNIDANDLPLVRAGCAYHDENEVLTLSNGFEIIDLVNYDDFDPWPVDDGYASISLVPADYPINDDYSNYTAEGNNSGAYWVLHSNGDAAGGRAQAAAAGVYGGEDIGSPCYLLGATSGNQPPTADPQDIFMAPGDTVDITLTGADATRPFFGLLFFVVRSLPENGELWDMTANHLINETDVGGPGYLLPYQPFNQLRYIHDGTEGVTSFNFRAYDGILGSPDTPVNLIIQSGEIALTEIMYNPNSNEPVPSVAEWVELYNTTSSPIDLAGWYLEDDEGRCGDLPSYILGAKSSVVLIPSAGDPYQFAYSWSAACVQPTLNGETSEGALTGQNLKNTGDELRLVKPGGDPLKLVSDAVYYLNEDPWPVTSPNDGPSIYLLPPESQYSAYENDDPTAWALSSLGVDGAYANIPTPIYDGADVGSSSVLQGVAQGDCSAAGTDDDGNGDGNVDQMDYEHFLLCYTGPLIGTPPLNCACFDTDGDGNVACDDYADFVANWTDPPPAPVPAPCEHCCADFDASTVIDLSDFATFALCYGLPGPSAECPTPDFACAD
ncbi:MAG: lamin tail domain-containing protein, partial [Phycisphaerales bacterium]